MLFVLGFIAGLVIASLVVTILIYFRRPIERISQVIEHKIDQAGPQERGFIYEPESEADQVREEIIEANRRRGKDTPLSDLISQ